ncbi:hypothetical protein SAMN05216296_1031 [Pseudomonas pohangensis]|uniref:Uncharacterized protein n=1 Tax=Pseudomonas pohangensis TaxID=364197 RepID=A0A1H2ERY4_9PSED|nr:hypothetical protein SAMN05216296_1031 [Pseudomonas pohangensis]
MYSQCNAQCLALQLPIYVETMRSSIHMGLAILMSRLNLPRLRALTSRGLALFNWKRCVTGEYKSGGSGVFAHGLNGELIYCPPVKKTNDTE